MYSPVRDPDLLTTMLGRRVLRMEEESAMGMQRVVALWLDGGGEHGMRFPMPTGNALRSAGEIAEIRALLSGLSRQVAAAIRRQVGPGDPALATDVIDVTIMAALADPDAFMDEQDPASSPLTQP